MTAGFVEENRRIAAVLPTRATADTQNGDERRSSRGAPAISQPDFDGRELEPVDQRVHTGGDADTERRRAATKKMASRMRNERPRGSAPGSRPKSRRGPQWARAADAGRSGTKTTARLEMAAGARRAPAHHTLAGSARSLVASPPGSGKKPPQIMPA